MLINLGFWRPGYQDFGYCFFIGKPVRQLAYETEMRRVCRPLPVYNNLIQNFCQTQTDAAHAVPLPDRVTFYIDRLYDLPEIRLGEYP